MEEGRAGKEREKERREGEKGREGEVQREREGMGVRRWEGRNISIRDVERVSIGKKKLWVTIARMVKGEWVEVKR